MKKKTWGILLVVLGVLMIALDFLVEPLGLGAGGFGWKQITLLAAGAAALGAGLVLSLVKGNK
jgi:hypothetical protein